MTAVLIMALAIQQTSLADPPQSGAIGAAASWVSDLFFGPIATSIAVLAIAFVGFAMLSGRMDIRRGLAVVLGCFLLFGAKGIAEGLQSSIGGEGMAVISGAQPPPTYTRAQPQANSSNGYDPYAGAAVGTTNVK